MFTITSRGLVRARSSMEIHRRLFLRRDGKNTSTTIISPSSSVFSTSPSPPAPAPPQPPPPRSASAEAAAAATKAVSRVYQRTVSPKYEREKVGDPAAADEAMSRAGGYVWGQVKGKTYTRVRNAILVRVATGFGIALPAVGVIFAAKAAAGEFARAWHVGEGVEEEEEVQGKSAGASPSASSSSPPPPLPSSQGGNIIAAKSAFTVAAGADAINVLVAGTSLARAIRDKAPSLHFPPAREPALLLRWYVEEYAPALDIPAALGPSLALLSTLAAVLGEIYLRYKSVREYARDKAPIATSHIEEAEEKLKEGKVQEATAHAVRAAHKAVDETLPDLTERKETREVVGDAIKEGVPLSKPAAEAGKQAAQSVADVLEEIARAAARDAKVVAEGEEDKGRRVLGKKEAGNGTGKKEGAGRGGERKASGRGLS